jgi:hypothetical protein
MAVSPDSLPEYRLPAATAIHRARFPGPLRRIFMNSIIYLVGLVVVVMFVLSLVGLR